MATKNSQRIGIWVIAIVMGIGTLGAYFGIIIANSNQNDQLTEQQAMMAQIEEQQKQQAATAQPLEGYTAEPFPAAAVTELKVEELKAGEGKEAVANSTVTANYFGWTSDGKIFDSSKKEGKATPIPFSLQGVIEGWTEGLTGAKPGSVRKLTIPGSMAYGDVDDGSGRPTGPLVFIVEVVGVE